MFLQNGSRIFFLPPSHPLCQGNKRGTCWLSEPLRVEWERAGELSGCVHISHRDIMNCGHFQPLPSPRPSSLPRNTEQASLFFPISVFEATLERHCSPLTQLSLLSVSFPEYLCRFMNVCVISWIFEVWRDAFVICPCKSDFEKGLKKNSVLR